MDMLNMTVTLSQQCGWQGWQEASGISGMIYQVDGGNPVTGLEPEQRNSGVLWNDWGAYTKMGSVPIAGPFQGFYTVPEAINPLYVGTYALGPYVRTPISMSGTPSTYVSSFAGAGAGAGVLDHDGE